MPTVQEVLVSLSFFPHLLFPFLFKTKTLLFPVLILIRRVSVNGTSHPSHTTVFLVSLCSCACHSMVPSQPCNDEQPRVKEQLKHTWIVTLYWLKCSTNILRLLGKEYMQGALSQHGTTVGVVTFAMRPRAARLIVDSFKSHWLHLSGLLNLQVSFSLWDTLCVLCTAIPQQTTLATQTQLYVVTKVPLREGWTSLWSLTYSDTTKEFLLRWKGRILQHSYKRHQ